MLKLKQKPTAELTHDVKAFGNRWIAKLFSVSEDWYKHRDITKNHFELGHRFLKRGDSQDAILRFTFITWLNKTHAEAWHGLGRAYLLAGKRAKAERALKKALELQPTLKDAKKTLAAIPAIYDVDIPKITVNSSTDVATLSAIHRDSFMKAWNEKAFTELLAVKGTEAWVNGLPDLSMGMIVGRALGEQYEILTIAVLPEWRGRGLARQLLETLSARAKETGAKALFLEVEQDNDVARKFYAGAAYEEVNRRKDYYRQEDGSFKDAVVMRRELA